MSIEEHALLPPPPPPTPLRTQVLLTLAARARVGFVLGAVLVVFLLAATSTLASHPAFSAVAVGVRLALVAWSWQLARSVDGATGRRAVRWLWSLGFATVLAGLSWGLMVALCVVVNGLGTATTLVLVATAGVLSGSVNIYAPVQVILRGYTAAVVAPVLVTVVTERDDPHAAVLALTFALYLAFLWAQGARTHRDFLGAVKNSSRLERRARQLHRSREVLRRIALYDPLTGALNRGEGIRSLEREIIRAGRERTRFVVLLLDLDHFKKINDTYGHAGGDAALCAVVERLQAALRSYDVVVRYGGEEFMVILPGCDLEKGARVAERLRKAIAGRPVVSGDRQIRVTASFGVVSGDGTAQRDPLVESADRALYLAKRSGRDRVESAVPPETPPRRGDGDAPAAQRQIPPPEALSPTGSTS